MEDRDDRALSQKLATPTPDEIDEVIDAVTGATWGERNRIMENRFAERLQREPRCRARLQPARHPALAGLNRRRGATAR